MSVERDSSAFATPVRPDPTDDRDLAFVADLEPGYVRPAAVDYEEYRRYVGTTWHQRGQECTGFALAAIANYYRRRHHDDPELASVSRRMMYEVAQKYDDEAWEKGSTLRGALKGWTRTGVALDDLWPYDPRDEDGSRFGTLTLARLLDARARPLLSYHKIDGDDVGTMQDALATGHPLYVCADLHVGWYRLFLPDVEPLISRRPDDADDGGHAFVIAGYDERGFWVHNSWGPEWGSEGYALLPYDDWRASHHDVWVVDLALDEPVPRTPPPPTDSEVASYRDLWQHLVVLDDEGRLASSGLYEMDGASLGTLLYLFQEHTADWPRRRLAIVADGGALPTATTIERFRGLRDRFLDAGIYPLFVVWETSWWADLEDDVDIWRMRLDADASDSPPVRAVVDRSIAGLMWHQIERRSAAACADESGGGQVLANKVAYKRAQKPFDLHLLSHGAGDLLMAGLASLLPGPLTTATAVASATALETFAESYAGLLDTDRLQHMSVIVDDAAGSGGTTVLGVPLLQLVSELDADAGEDSAPDGQPTGRRPLLGLRVDVDADATVGGHRTTGRLVVSTSTQISHVDLLADPDSIERIIDGMLQHESSAAPAPAPDVDGGRGADDPNPLPLDPLARAEAVRERGRAS